MAKIEIYTTNVCPYCVRAKDLLKRKGQEYTEISAEDPEVRMKVVERAGGQRTVPQIFINGEHVGGSDDLYALDREGKLDAMLAA